MAFMAFMAFMACFILFIALVQRGKQQRPRFVGEGVFVQKQVGAQSIFQAAAQTEQHKLNLTAVQPRLRQRKFLLAAGNQAGRSAAAVGLRGVGRLW
jgi:hypothetical protein